MISGVKKSVLCSASQYWAEKNLDKNGKVLYYNKRDSNKCNEEEEYTVEHFRERTGSCCEVCTVNLWKVASEQYF